MENIKKFEQRTIDQIEAVVGFDAKATAQEKAALVRQLRSFADGGGGDSRPLVNKDELIQLLGRTPSRTTLANWAKRGWLERVCYPTCKRALGYTRESVERFIASGRGGAA